MEEFTFWVWIATAFFVGLAIATHQTSKQWNALVDRSNMNGRRWRLMFLEASEKYWRTRAEICALTGSAIADTCTENADGYKQEADELRPEVTDP